MCRHRVSLFQPNGFAFSPSQSHNDGQHCYSPTHSASPNRIWLTFTRMKVIENVPLTILQNNIFLRPIKFAFTLEEAPLTKIYQCWSLGGPALHVSRPCICTYPEPCICTRVSKAAHINIHGSARIYGTAHILQYFVIEDLCRKPSIYRIDPSVLCTNNEPDL